MRGAGVDPGAPGSGLALRDRPPRPRRQRDGGRGRATTAFQCVADGAVVSQRPGTHASRSEDRRDAGGGGVQVMRGHLARAADAAVRDVSARAADCGGQPRQPAARARRPRAGGDPEPRSARRPDGWSASRSPKGSCCRWLGAPAPSRRRCSPRARRCRLAFPPRRALPLQLPPSPVIVLFSIALALVTGTVFAAAPAWATARTHPIDALRGVAREGADRSFVPRRSLVIVQVALSLVLLAGAGLLAESLSRLEQQPLGFEPSGRLIVAHRSASAGERARAPCQPTTRDAAPSRAGAGGRACQLRALQPDGGQQLVERHRDRGPARRSGKRDSSSWNRVGPGYFEADRDARPARPRHYRRGYARLAARRGGEQAFAQRFFAGADPIGGQLGIGDASHSTRLLHRRRRRGREVYERAPADAADDVPSGDAAGDVRHARRKAWCRRVRR